MIKKIIITCVYEWDEMPDFFWYKNRILYYHNHNNNNNNSSYLRQWSKNSKTYNTICTKEKRIEVMPWWQKKSFVCLFGVFIRFGLSFFSSSIINICRHCFAILHFYKYTIELPCINWCIWIFFPLHVIDYRDDRSIKLSDNNE